jgi:glycosyltransferase involved in cell wall biosynthesis
VTSDTIARIMTGATDVVVILSANPMHDTGGGQRSTQVALELLERGFAVVFVSHGRVTETVDLGLTYDHPRLAQMPLAALDDPVALEALAPLWKLGRAFVVTQIPVRAWAPVLEAAHRHGAVTVYDCIDRWDSELGRGWYEVSVEREIARTADARVASAPALVEHVEHLTERQAHLLPNAFNARLFNGEPASERPADLPGGDRTALYVGALWGGWMDWMLVDTVARAHPRTTFAFIGDRRKEGRGLPSNCSFLGLKPQSALPGYLASADVAFVPWRVDAVTRATSPLKVYEFVAMDLPVVAPDIEPLRGIPGVFTCARAADFVHAVGAVDRYALDDEARAAMRSFSAANSWKARVDGLLDIVGGVAAGAGVDGGVPAIVTGATLSVVMPAYNHERYIGAAVDGVRDQSLPASELVIVDDGSTDGTRDVLEAHRFRAMRTVFQENRGAHRALNRAIALSRGDWIAILNSDDVYEPERLEHAWGVARATKAALVCGSVRLIDEEGANADPEHAIARWYREARAHARSAGSLRAALAKHNVAVTSSNFFIHRELWRRLGGFNAYRYVHDYDFLLRAVALCPDRVHYAAELSGVLYRVHGVNTIGESSEHAWHERASMMRDFRRPAARLERLVSRPAGARAVRKAVDAGDSLATGPFGADVDLPGVSGGTSARSSRESPLRIGIVVESLGTGGLEEVVAVLAQTLPVLGVPVSVLCSRSGGSVADRLVRAGVPVLVGGGRERAWRAWLDAERPAVVSSHFAQPDVVKSLSGTGVPVVETIQNLYAWYTSSDWEVERTKLEHLHSTIAVSETVAAYYEAHTGHASARVIPNAVHPGRAAAVPRAFARRVLGVEPDTPLFSSVGRIAAQKNPDGLLAAFSRALTEVPDARLLLVGPADRSVPLSRLKARHRGLFRSGSVRHVATIRDVGTVLSAADAFVSNSYHEGWSVAASEALWVGRPVVLSETGGSVELVGAGSERGIVVVNACGGPLVADKRSIADPPPGAVAANQARFAEALVSVAENRERWRTRSGDLRAYARSTLSPAVIGRSYLEALRAVAQDAGARG